MVLVNIQCLYFGYTGIGGLKPICIAARASLCLTYFGVKILRSLDQTIGRAS